VKNTTMFHFILKRDRDRRVLKKMLKDCHNDNLIGGHFCAHGRDGHDHALKS
jgi:hypothetical protein